MASRRKLKKNVNVIIAELLTHCFVQDALNPQIDREKLDEVFKDLFLVREEYISRISHTEPGNAKKYYRNFRDKFSSDISDIMAKMTNLA